MGQRRHLVPFGDSYLPRTITVSDLADVRSYLQSLDGIAKVEVRRLFDDGTLGPEIELADAAPGALRRLRLVALSSDDYELISIELGKDGTASMSKAGGVYGPNSELMPSKVAEIDEAARMATTMLRERGYRRPGPASAWLLALVGLVVGALGLLTWSTLVLVQLNLRTRVILQAEAIVAAIVAAIVVPLVLKCERRRRVVRGQPGRVWVSARSRSASRILRENVTLAVVVAVVTAAVTTLVTN